MTSELIFVGLGLSGTDGMTVKALNALKECDKIYAEFYTSTLIGTKVEDLEAHRQEDQGPVQGTGRGVR